MTDRRIAFHTLGCKLNQYDTQSLLELFKDEGYSIVDFSEKADVYVINTCTVTGSGERKSRQAINRAVRTNPEALVVVTGCYAQTAPGEVMGIKGVDLVIGNQDRGRIVQLTEEAASQGPNVVVGDILQAKEFEELPVTDFFGRTRAALKIQEGCNQFCSYCKIPYARGPSRSRNLDAVVQEARRLAERGFREIVLTGIHLGAYGTDLSPPSDLAEAIRTLSDIEGLARIRLGSVDAPEIDDELIETIRTHPKACRHLHIPLQAGDDDVLNSMRRPYALQEYRDVIHRVRSGLPGVAITTDIIVGFPGETDTQFQRALEFVKEMAFSRLHVFRYSPRRGTAAARFPNQIPASVKSERSQQMIQLGKELSLAFHRTYLGKRVEVLWEEAIADLSECVWEGHTSTYVKVQSHRIQGEPGDLEIVEIQRADEEGIGGKIVEDWLGTSGHFRLGGCEHR
ncbi:MAG: tRNA (N(6)-L-threonylcarbamoyladenosine(37)-C(2))-methylthiotransferase MtaB [Firmicutes bacterium]|nr:tRNA (N(6)-L-threonylcarbamoyladenosine(37)-C(2))-methylthiotransferase MtaB [Bacillota bacterium]